MATSKQSVVVGLSGGVDSAVSAYLLQKKGFKVTGIFLKTYEPPSAYTGECHWKEDQESAQSVAHHLHIPFETWNLEAAYKDTVLAYFFDELKRGRTPNPDVMCNKEIKFGIFADRARERGFDKIATGHYARIESANGTNLVLMRGIDPDKDQSYFLGRVPQKSLCDIIFPIGSMLKKDVRKVAQEVGLPNSKRPDSQGICFLGIDDVSQFIDLYLPSKRGPIQTISGKTLGTHSGLVHYTIGQREGLRIGGPGSAYFVVNKDVQKNILFVAQGADNPLLYSDTACIRDVEWYVDVKDLSALFNIQIRYRQEPQKARIEKNTASIFTIHFLKKQRAITPGQLAVIYDKHTRVASGIIE